MSQFAGFFRVQYNFSLTNYIKCPLFALGCNSNIIGKFGNFIKFYGKIPDIFVLITGHFGLFKTPTLRLGEAGKTQSHSQTRRLRIAKINFKSVRKTITCQPNTFTPAMTAILQSQPTNQIHLPLQFSSSRLRTAINASCGTSTLPIAFIRFLPRFCFSRSLRLREISPP